MAWVFRKYTKNQDLIKLETEAKNKRVGLWSDEAPIEPSVSRKSKNTIPK